MLPNSHDFHIHISYLQFVLSCAQAAAAIGNGIVRSGTVSSTIGTSGVVFASTDNLITDKLGRVHTFCHAIPNTWHIMGVTGAGLSLKWFRDNFCAEEKSVAENMKIDPYVLMDKIAETIKPGCEGVIYLPYLMGERTPTLIPMQEVCSLVFQQNIPKRICCVRLWRALPSALKIA